MRNLSILVDGGKRGVIMHCYDCLKKDWCPYIHQFNHDPSVGCIDFQDRDYTTTSVSNTLNIKEENMSKELTPLEVSKQLKDFVLEFVKNGLDRMFVDGSFDIIDKKLKALHIIKECLVSEFKLFEKDGEYFILFYFDELHQLTFKLKGKEEFDLLKEVLYN